VNKIPVIVLGFVVLIAVAVGVIAMQKKTPVAIQVATNKTIRPMLGEESFGLSVCDEVPKALVEEIARMPIVKTVDKSDGFGTSCSYLTNVEKNEFVIVEVGFKEAENQRIGQQAMGRTIKTDPSIPMENFVAWQEDGQINAVYLVMAPSKFIRVDRTGGTITNDQLIALAQKVATIAVYK